MPAPEAFETREERIAELGAVLVCQRLEIGCTRPCTQVPWGNPLEHLRSQCSKGVFGVQNGE